MSITEYLKTKKQAYTRLFQETWTMTAIHGPGQALEHAKEVNQTNGTK
jgi:hypothetical protein